MSQKCKSGKRQVNRSDEGPVPSKRRKGRPKAAPPPDDEDEGWTPRNVGDMKANAIYNQRAPEAPAELFRKDLISAMKLPDSEPLNADEYWVITDQWKQDWERGVQVPVNPDSLPQPCVTVTHHSYPRAQEFRLPKSKYIRITKDERFRGDEFHLSSVAARAEASCHYDLDDVDVAWLGAMNGERALMGLPPLTEEQLERVLEELERRCWDKIQGLVKAEEGLGIEYDENVICDVCRSPDSEEGNEMVFCDSCNICVHQACYGITSIPPGSWLCRTCALSKRPECVLCPNKGGAMKCTKSGHEWAHVSCALWIPEVSIGCVEKMEPITKISNIPQSRWALICVLCRERVGACIQCSVKTCKTAYHVTCAFKHGLEMRAIIEDENADDGVKLRSYCQKHSVKKENRSAGSDDEESRRKKRKDMTSEEKNQARAAKLHEIEAEFYKHVSVADVSGSAALLEVDSSAIEHVYNYWKLKRRAGNNRPLLLPRSEDGDLLGKGQEQQDLDKMKMFVQLRQDLERVRNLCYMVSRREKLSRSFFKTREQTFHKQAVLVTSGALAQAELAAVVEANHGPSIYDRLYSHPNAQDNSESFEKILAVIEGVTSPEFKSRQDLNGLIKPEDKPANPYKRMYFNGATRRRSLFGSTSESETDLEKRNYASIDRLVLHSADSSTDEEKKAEVRVRSKKALERRRKDSKVVDSSSSEERWKSPRGRSLRQMERDMGDKSFSEDSDDLLPLPKSDTIKKMNAIYSDSDSETSLKDDRSCSSQHIMKTKGELKAFTGIPKFDKDNKERDKASPKPDRSKASYLKRSRRDLSNEDEENRDDKENIKSSRKGFDPSELIVPQRQAAKKASENLKCFQGKKEEAAILADDLNKIEKPKEGDRFDKAKSKIRSRSRLAREERGKSSDVFEFEHSEKEEGSDFLAYVPQRQAAKKAAETIKCGMKLTEEMKGVEKKKEEAKRGAERVRRSGLSGSKSPRSTKLSTSTTSSSSSSSSTSSSSSSESEEEPKKSIFDPEPKKKTDDWPFLDKESQPKSDDGKRFKRAPEKKLKTSDGRPEIEFQPPATEREESSRKRGLGDRIGGSSARPGNLFLDAAHEPVDAERRKRKPVPEAEELLEAKTKSASSTPKKSSKEIDLESEMCQRRLTPRKPNKLDRLFESAKGKTAEELSRGKSEEQPVKRGPGRPRKAEGGRAKASPEVKNDRIKDNRDKFIPIPEEKPGRARPMPKSAKRALGLLDESSGAEEERKDGEAAKEKAEETSVTGSDVSDKNYDKDKFRRSGHSGSDKPEDSKVNNNNNLVNSDMNLDSKPELSLGGLGMEEKHVSPVEDMVGRSNFSLDLGLPESSAGEPKKISSRTSSLGVPAYPHRSIFSPQTSNRDHLSDIFDFENDILAVDETVHEDPRPLQFNFSNEFLFKEDSKEDSKRETYNLVEKLRMEYAKKTTSQQEGASPATGPEEPLAEVKDEKTEVIKAAEVVQSNELLKENQSPGYGKRPPLAPSLQAAESTPQADQGKFTPKSQGGVTPASNLESPAAYPSQKTPQPDMVTPRYPEGPPPMQDTDQSPAGYPPPRQGFEAPDTYDNFYGPCPPMQQDSTNMIPEIRDSMEASASSDDRWVPPNSNASSLYQSPSETPYQSSPYQRGRSRWPDSEVISRRSSSSSSVESAKDDGEAPKHDPHAHPKPDDPKTRNELLPDPKKLPDTPHYAPHPPPAPPLDDHAKLDNPHFTQELHNKIVEAIKADVQTKHGDLLAFQQTLQKNDDSVPFPHPDLYHPAIAPFLPDNAPYNPYSDASPFVAPVLFPPNPCAPLPFPSPSSALFQGSFPPAFPPAHPIVHSIPPKPDDPLAMVPPLPPPVVPAPPPCSASFTSSQHNMALTAAIVSPPAATPVALEPPLTPTHFPNAVTPDQNSFPNHHADSPHRPLGNATNTTPPNKKPPPKATRVSARVISQGKSPAKSPGKSPGKKSPRQLPLVQDKLQVARARDSSKRSRPPANARNRGRGRAKPKGPPAYDDFAIRTKLEGTVYDMDFDEDNTSDGMENLKAMRERRKSTDVHDRKPDALAPREPPSPAPKFSSPTPKHHKPPLSPAPAPAHPPPTPPHSFPDVAPPLPGPVDMRTYSSFEPPVNTAEYLLNAFANPAEAPHVNEFDEEMEKELHSALRASRPLSPPKDRTPPPAPAPPPPLHSPPAPRPDPSETPDPLNKVSLSDSRNQLKVKIKGPFLDANYAASNAPIPAPPPAQATPPAAIISAAATGTSSLRRMRKKELLRQYWNQDMNTDDPAAPIAPAAPPPSRSSITIPKAVASMTSIPTREDYKALIDANLDKKRKKEKPVRDFRGFDLTFPPPDDELSIPERRNSTGSNPSALLDGSTPKRRPRTSKPTTPAASAAAPKLKIKICGSEAAVTVRPPEEKKNLRVRPPKKRHCNIVMPSVEELKRESMKYRRKIMADFDESDKKSTKTKSKKKKKKSKELEVIGAQAFGGAPKIIIKLRKPGEGSERLTVGPGGPPAPDAPPAPPPAEVPSPREADPLAVDPLQPPAPPEAPPPTEPPPATADPDPDLSNLRTSKTTPIRLKLSRCEEGYVMAARNETPPEPLPPPECPVPVR